jgi:hypothetical protein
MADVTSTTVYIKAKTLEEIIILYDFEPYSTLYHIILRACHLMIDEDPEGIEYLKIFRNRGSLKTFQLGYVKELHNNEISEIDLSKFSKDIFILDRPGNECDELQNKFGVVVLSTSTLDKMPAFCDPDEEFEKTKEQVSASRGWFPLFRERKYVPSNSALIIDSYFFSNKIEVALENLLEITKALCNEPLAIPFQIFIIASNEKNVLTKKVLVDFKKTFEEKVNSQVKSEVHLGIAVIKQKTDLHERYIFTGYTRYKTERSFSCFEKSRIIPTKEQPFLVTSYFTKANNKKTALGLDFFKEQAIEFINQLEDTRSYQGKPNEDYFLLVGDHENRLLT